MRRKKTILAVVVLFGLGVAAGGLSYFYPRLRSDAPSARLVGRWEGTGRQKTAMEFTVKPGQEVAGGTENIPLSLSSSVQAEFHADGSYTWKEELTASGLKLNLWLPKEGEASPRWEVIKTQGDQATVRLHLGEVDLQFNGRDSFKVIFPESGKVSGEINFRRVP